MAQEGQSRPQRRRAQRSQVPTEMTARYVKSNLDRVIHVDGVYGGPTTAGTLWMAFFSEHQVIPESAEFTVDQDTKLINPKPAAPRSRQEWIREIEAELIVSLDMARSLRAWLDDKIKIMETVGDDRIYRLNEQGSSAGDTS